MATHRKHVTEKLIREEPQAGRFRPVDETSVEDVRARRKARKTPAEAVAHIRETRKGNRLPAGVTIKDLIDEGRA
jgi:hypothetical protein